jgi:hypothetical protein
LDLLLYLHKELLCRGLRVLSFCVLSYLLGRPLCGLIQTLSKRGKGFFLFLMIEVDDGDENKKKKVGDVWMVTIGNITKV